MIYKEGEYCFIHIPRCAGHSVETTTPLEHNMLIATNRVGSIHRHNTARELSLLLPDWDHIRKWCVVRNPWSIVDSLLRLFRWVPWDWGPFTTNCFQSPGEFAQSTLRRCDFYHVFTEGFEVEPVQFDNITPTLPRTNTAQGVVEWSDKDIEIVGDLAQADIRRFGYGVPTLQRKN